MTLLFKKGGVLIMAKKAVKKSASSAKKIDLHKELERPVNNLVGYTILFLVALVLLMLVKNKLMF